MSNICSSADSSFGKSLERSFQFPPFLSSPTESQTPTPLPYACPQQSHFYQSGLLLENQTANQVEVEKKQHMGRSVF